MNNKRFSFLLASFLSVVVAVGCVGGKAPSSNRLVDSVAQNATVSKSDKKEKKVSLMLDSIGKSYSTDKGEVDFACAFPVSGPQPLVDSLRAYISSELSWGTVLDGEEVKNLKPYGNAADGKGMVNYYAELAHKNISSILDDVEEPVAWKPSVSKFVMKDNETSSYVSYLTTYSAYMGGAHGMAICYGLTFDKKTGAALQNILNPKDLKVLQPVLREGLKSYFRSIVEPVDGETIEGLVGDDMAVINTVDGIIQLPENGVYLSPEGVVFIYRQYEIGAYAIGMPTFTVPYSKIGKFLSPEARRLAGIK